MTAHAVSPKSQKTYAEISQSDDAPIDTSDPLSVPRGLLFASVISIILWVALFRIVQIMIW